MDLALLLFALFWGLFGKKEGSSAPAPAGQPAPGGPPAPWPQVTPSGLPPFPGSGWEYDEPPPRPVQERARQLLSQLWGKGQGTFKIEQTAGRWIAYRAEITRGNKHGVVAYRERKAARLAPASPASPAAPYLKPQATPRVVFGAWGIRTSTAPVVHLQKGHTYRIESEFISSSRPFTEEMIADFAKGLALGGARDIALEKGPPMRWAFTQTSAVDTDLQIGIPYTLRFGTLEMTFKVLSVDEAGLQVSYTPPGVPVEPAVAPTILQLPTLRVGAGMPPKAPLADVRLLQNKLAIPADGRFGNNTLAAVKEFQRRRGLAADGIVGAKTWTALFGASGG